VCVTQIEEIERVQAEAEAPALAWHAPRRGPGRGIPSIAASRHRSMLLGRMETRPTGSGRRILRHPGRRTSGYARRRRSARIKAECCHRRCHSSSEALAGSGMTIAAAAAIVGCSRQTGSKWVNRQRRGEGLEDRSSRPHRSPRRRPPGEATPSPLLIGRPSTCALSSPRIPRSIWPPEGQTFLSRDRATRSRASAVAVTPSFAEPASARVPPSGRG
jgi:transposase-like protein